MNPGPDFLPHLNRRLMGELIANKSLWHLSVFCQLLVFMLKLWWPFERSSVKTHFFSCVCLKRRALLKFSESLKPKQPGNITVSHFSYAPLFQGPHFLTKMLESNILYDNLFIDIYLFDDIEKKYWNHSCESFCYVKDNFDKNAKMHVQAARLYFLF